MSNIGIVQVNKEYLARILGYKDGDVKDIRMLTDTGVNIVEFVIEHPSFPEVEDGYYIPITDRVIVRH